MKDEVTRFKEICSELDGLEEKKIRIEEQFKAKKAALQELIAEIQKAGYDPTKLNETIEEKSASLTKDLEAFEGKVQKVSDVLSAVEV